jgi:hypothetical protein
VPDKPKEEKKVVQPEIKTSTGKNSIMGNSEVSAEQMVQFLLKNNSKPLLYRMDIKEFCQLYLDMGKAEGVKGDIAFCQACKETGYFRFGGDVVEEQMNYAGIGTTGGGVKGQYFKSQKEGILAQIQHLKAYASTEALKLENVDPRYKYVTKGIAPNWEDLNGRWAVPGNNYGQEILQIFKRLKEEKVEIVIEKKKEEIKVEEVKPIEVKEETKEVKREDKINIVIEPLPVIKKEEVKKIESKSSIDFIIMFIENILMLLKRIFKK